jgi:hypothetical protein
MKRSACEKTALFYGKQVFFFIQALFGAAIFVRFVKKCSLFHFEIEN